MKNKKKFRLMAIIMGALMGLTTFAGCGDDVTIDNTKTQLYLSYYHAGLGDAWIKRYAAEFEEYCKDYQGKDGKVGVQVVVDPAYTSSLDSVQSLVNGRSEVIFCEAVPYNRLALSGIALDITDIVDAKLTEFGEDCTIGDKIEEGQLEYYRAVDGKVYQLPWFDYMKGVIYDVDIFEGKFSQGHGFYLADNGGFTSGLEGAPAKAAGPDNVKGTYDDGLPVTHEQFFEMMDEMVSYGITPFTFTGMHTYSDSFFTNLWVNQEGAEQFKLNTTYDGVAKDLVNVEFKCKGENRAIRRDANNQPLDPIEYDDNDQPVYIVTPLGDTVINNENAYLLNKQEGKFRAYEFQRRFVDDTSYYAKNAFGQTHTHVGAEEDFLYNVTKQEKAAMLIDGIWWEEEATSIFTSMEDLSEAYSRYNRRFAWMPMPYYTVDEESDEPRTQTVSFESPTGVFIKSNIDPDKIALAKKFMQFISTDDMLLAHAEEIGTPRGMSLYNESKIENSTKLSPFAKSVVQYRNAATVVSPNSSNKFQWHVANSYYQVYNQATIEGSAVSGSTFAFHNHAEYEALDFFNGAYKRIYDRWQNALDTFKA